MENRFTSTLSSGFFRVLLCWAALGPLPSLHHSEWMEHKKNFFFFFFFFFFGLFVFSRAASVAHGGTQARGHIGALAAGLHHSSRQRWILNPLIEAWDQTRNLMVPSRIC